MGSGNLCRWRLILGSGSITALVANVRYTGLNPLSEYIPSSNTSMSWTLVVVAEARLQRIALEPMKFRAREQGEPIEELVMSENALSELVSDGQKPTRNMSFKRGLLSPGSGPTRRRLEILRRLKHRESQG